MVFPYGRLRARDVILENLVRSVNFFIKYENNKTQINLRFYRLRVVVPFFLTEPY